MARTPAVLDQINLVVRDMQAAVDFYERLGVTIPDTLPEWQAHHRPAEVENSVALDFDSAAFAPQWMESWPSSRTGVVLTPAERIVNNPGSILPPEAIPRNGSASEASPLPGRPRLRCCAKPVRPTTIVAIATKEINHRFVWNIGATRFS